MESKHILRIGLVFSLMLLLSVYNAEQQSKRIAAHQSTHDHIFPYNGIFHTVANVFDQAIHDDGRHPIDHAESDMGASYQQLPPSLVSGVVNQEAIWQVKVGPFYDMAEVEDLTRYLLSNNYQVLIRVDLDESGYACTAYVQPTAQKHTAEMVREELGKRYPHAVEVTTGYL